MQGELKSTSFIDSSDVPDIDKETEISLNYYRYDGTSLVEMDEYETFRLKSYKAEKSILSQNKLRLTSKDEIVDGLDIELSSLSKNDLIENNHFLFLVSSEYIDNRDSDVRGEIAIPKKKELSNNQANLFVEENIYLDDISLAINTTINNLYPEFGDTQKKHQEDLERLKKMFLVDDTAVAEVKISLNDNDNKVLEKIYSHEAKKVAKIDASLKERIEHLNDLDTTSDGYTEELRQEIESLTKDIPQQNKIALTKYVARRKLVLDLFQKILDQSLKRQVSGERNIDEKLLHNLIFQQSNTDPNKSDLWLINEEFIYFKGSSEERLTDIKINGTPLLRQDLSEAEQEHRKSLDEDRYTKRPDVLLFPEESKCIIIEFKNPDVNASDHLLQINNYASLIWNYSSSKHQFTTFYGYLIGEKLSNMDIQSKDSDFQIAYGFDYIFRPYKPILGFFDKERDNAHLYTEVIRYSTLLERAKKRNQVFIDKLISDNS